MKKLVTGLAAASMSVLMFVPATPARAETGSHHCPEVTGSVHRLYQAYFLREPDRSGFHYWLGKYFSGTSLTLISDTFTRSAEYRSRYEGLNNRDFVRLVYNNVLEREPDQAGWDYWTGVLDRGALPRGGVMIRFSESPEFVAKTGTATPLVIPPGTFIYCGRSDDVIEIATPGGGKGAILHAVMHGSGHNAVVSHDQNFEYNELLVNEIGAYRGSNLMDLSPYEAKSRHLEVTSDGAWVIQIRPLSSAPRFVGRVDSGGDRVLYYAGGRTVGHFVHHGESNFVVEAVTATDWDLVVNEIGRYDGRNPVENAPAYIAVTADGAWTVEIPG